MAVKKVRVQINGSWVELTKNGSTGKYEGTIAAPNITSFNVNAGNYYPVIVESEDLAGNKTTATDTHATLGSKCKLYVKEITKPTTTITSPTAGAFVTNSKPSITFQLRDEVNGSGIKISTLKLKVNATTFTNVSPGMAVNAVSNGYDVTYTLQTALADGSHTITLDVDDNDGNKAVQAIRAFKIDTVPPELSIFNPTEPTSYVNTSIFNVSGNTNDVTSGPVSITIKLRGTDQGAITVDGSGNFNKNITLIEGSNVVIIRATDAAGKYSEVTYTVILDTVAPVITNITIAPNPVNVGQSYLITVEAAD